ncbi:MULTISPECIES: class I SAM-dependent methyltransferase [Pseudonocardia]|uniref:Ubiquinone/menaquinone biosynthesis C-methyltransferase UbiE n=2 Tax=Pseudonocardia TaxID=1847 RepID=A0A1Y2MU25_PSEAH|nr:MULTISPECIES: class I SAM-dependent methyltransferase [Pseudonocardia]OSY38267.1 Ubiquinone/menaquinone biosynthesis C-methyltransferase UbiE [Pseudonocardia autotrophica]TDN71007.1 methyltransferase family protein [Pseudonocardia autotrophica]BBG01675.1 SAM-dependent methyltransferase [Pseudonocardia autotrophica]GEC25420.1 SAM-dependent methyltransferase [Pseudonocardia saturnea]
MSSRDEYSSAESVLGTTGLARRRVSSAESESAGRRWWDADADDYLHEHGSDIGDAEFVWCPESLHEEDARLLAPAEALPGARVLEVGAGSAPCSRWLAAQGALPVALDVSGGMLRHAARLNRELGTDVPLVQAGAEHLPFADRSFDLACSAFGAIPFVADPARVMREVYRVLRPGGRWVFAVNHPMRWAFSDDPGPAGLTVTQSYFDRTPYLEVDATGRATYVEHHRTLGDRIRDVVAAGLVLEDLVEPEWPEGHDRIWGQWSPLRGELFPGTAIFVTRRPAAAQTSSTAPVGRS